MATTKHKPENDVTLEDFKDAISVLNESMDKNTGATVQTGKDVVELKGQMGSLEAEMKTTREQMASYTTFLQGCVEKVINGKSAAIVEDSKAQHTRTVTKAKSQAAIDKAKAAARNKLIERCVSWGLTALALFLFGADKVGWF